VRGGSDWFVKLGYPPLMLKMTLCVSRHGIFPIERGSWGQITPSEVSQVGGKFRVRVGNLSVLSKGHLVATKNTYKGRVELVGGDEESKDMVALLSVYFDGDDYYKG
jgi:hypothetical protein